MSRLQKVLNRGLYGYRWGYILRRPNKIVKYTHQNTKWFIQRGRRGWSTCDAWSIDYYITRVLSEMLTHMAHHHVSLPANSEWTDAAITTEEWTEILLDMAAGFEGIWRTIDDHPSKEVMEEREARFKHSLELFERWHWNLWD